MIEQVGDTWQVLEWTIASHHVIDRQHGVRLTAAECCLQLDNRVTALTIESFSHRGEQQAHSLRNKSALEKSCRILVLRRGFASMNGGDIRSKLRLQESAFQNVRMRNGYFAPG